MASVNSFSSNSDLVHYLKRTGNIKSDIVFNTLSSLDRKNFTPVPNKAYIDEPHIIGHEKTITSPHMHAQILELIAHKLQNGGQALDIGSGSGYLSACMAKIMGDKGFVTGMDCIPDFRDMAKKNIKEKYPDLDKNIKFVVGDGKLGYPAKAPYNVIVVGAAAAEVPQVLIDQLAPGGRLIMPVGSDSDSQSLMQIDKSYNGTIEKKKIMDVIYGFLSDVKESEMLWPDIKKDISSFNAFMKDVQTKLASIDKNICRECQVRKDETENIYKKIEDLQKIMKGEVGGLKKKIDKMASEHDEKLKKEIDDVDSRSEAIKTLIGNVQSDVKAVEQKMKIDVNNNVGQKIESLEDKIKSTLDEYKVHMTNTDEAIKKMNMNIDLFQKKNEKIKDSVSEYMRDWNKESIVKYEELKKIIADQSESNKRTEERITSKTKDLVTKVGGIQSSGERLEKIEKQMKLVSTLLREQRNASMVQGQILKLQQEKLEKLDTEKMQAKKRMESEKRLKELTTTVAKVNKEIQTLKMTMANDLSETEQKSSEMRSEDDSSNLFSKIGNFQKEVDLLKILMSYREKEQSYDKQILRDRSQNVFGDAWEHADDLLDD